MHNTSRALATQWDAPLGYYCQARGWHWKTADAVGRMPAGHLVSSQLSFFFLTLHFCILIADPSSLATWVQCLVRCSEQQQQKTSSKQTITKGKRASQSKQFVFPSKLASCSNTRGQQWAPRETLKSQFYGGWVMARRIMLSEAYQLCFYVVYTR